MEGLEEKGLETNNAVLIGVVLSPPTIRHRIRSAPPLKQLGP